MFCQPFPAALTHGSLLLIPYIPLKNYQPSNGCYFISQPTGPFLSDAKTYCTINTKIWNKVRACRQTWIQLYLMLPKKIPDIIFQKQQSNTNLHPFLFLLTCLVKYKIKVWPTTERFCCCIDLR